jgi:hypothetical protein
MGRSRAYHWRMHSGFACPVDDRHHPRARRYCAHFGRYVSGGVWCLRDLHMSAGGRGCVFFLRESGADDDERAPANWSRRTLRNRYARAVLYKSPGRPDVREYVRRGDGARSRIDPELVGDEDWAAEAIADWYSLHPEARRRTGCRGRGSNGQRIRGKPSWDPVREREIVVADVLADKFNLKPFSRYRIRLCNYAMHECRRDPVGNQYSSGLCRGISSED